jgi:hypothetical protein
MEGFVGAEGKPDPYLKGSDGVILKLSECVLYDAIDPAISEKNTADFFAMAGWPRTRTVPAVFRLRAWTGCPTIY